MREDYYLVDRIHPDKMYRIRLRISDSPDLYMLSETLRAINDIATCTELAYRNPGIFSEGGPYVRKLLRDKPEYRPKIKKLGDGSLLIDILVAGAAILNILDTIRRLKGPASHVRIKHRRSSGGRDDVIELIPGDSIRVIEDKVREESGSKGLRTYRGKLGYARMRFGRGLYHNKATKTELEIEIEERQ